MSEITKREMILAEALKAVLIASGVLSKDAEPTGPELICAADTYCEHKASEVSGG